MTVAARIRAAVDPAREARYGRDLGRAFAGALLFNIPLLMTMEMWELGAVTGPWRMAAYLALGLPLLFGLAHYAGFSATRGFTNNLLDTLAAVAVGAMVAAGLLALFGVIGMMTPPREVAGHLTLQAIAGAMGALLARRQMTEPGDAGGGDPGDESGASYVGELFLMGAGALFLALNLAPTEEMLVIAFKASPWQALGVMAASLALLHLVVYRAGFAGQEESGHPVLAFFHFTLPGYAIALAVSLFMLWAFGRADGMSPHELAATTAVLGFPASLGAAAARLLV